ncbi:histidine phosphatase superfamily [Nemania serpens]|nr:histidine phosphatase superfamily [Nemania serpens]
MAPTIHILRHAHAAHQSNPDLIIHDPELTELGIQQCQTLAADIAKLGKIDLILCSPLKRAIQTAVTAFPAYMQSQSQIVLLPDLQESGTENSDVGSSRADLVRQFGSAHLDCSFLDAAWTNKGPGTRYDPRFATARARATRLFIRAIAQRYRNTYAHIVAVSHSAYIGHLTRGVAHDDAEWRSFRFEQIVGGDGEAELYELPCSITRRLAARCKPQEEFEIGFDARNSAKESVWVKQEEEEEEEEEEQRPIGCFPGDVHEVYCPMYEAKAPTTRKSRRSARLALASAGPELSGNMPIKREMSE